MTDSMNFGPEWLRNLSSDGSTTGGTGGTRYLLSGHRYGREEMLGLYEKGFKPPSSLSSFNSLYSEMALVPLALTPSTEDDRDWQARTVPPGPASRGVRGTSLDRGGRINRGRGSYQPYNRNANYENSGGWGNGGEQSDWSPRKEYGYRGSSMENWRRGRTDDDDGWRSNNLGRGPSEKWGRSISWREEDKDITQERVRGWNDGPRGHNQRRIWDNEDNIPEWATETPSETKGTFDSSGAYHGSDEDQVQDTKRMTPPKKEPPLQKSLSQQNISAKHQQPLATSKSVTSLPKTTNNQSEKEEKMLELKEVHKVNKNRKKDILLETNDPLSNFATNETSITEERKLEKCSQNVPKTDITHSSGDTPVNGVPKELDSKNKADEDFDRLQEDLVLKLVVDEELPKDPQLSNLGITMGGTPQPPPNLAPPIQEKWFYRDPQGDLQGPFVCSEMADWFKAGYFSMALLVRRNCDKGFYTLGDLVMLCSGINPFSSNIRIPPLTEHFKISDQDMVSLQILQAQLALSQARPYTPNDWNNLPALPQHLLAQQSLNLSQIPSNLQYMQQPQPQLMHMMQPQQVNSVPDKCNIIPVPVDPIRMLVQQMGMMRMQQNNVGVPGNVCPTTNVQTESLVNNFPGIQGPISGTAMTPNNLGGLQTGLGAANILPSSSLPAKPTIDALGTPNDNNPIHNLLRQFQNKQSQSQQIDSLWQQNTFRSTQQPPTNQHWQQQQPEETRAMWELQKPPSPESTMTLSQTPPVDVTKLHEDTPLITKEKEKTKEASVKEEKRKKEQEEKQAKKEAEEKRKAEQRQQEAERKAAEDKRKKDEERVRKELEKSRKEAEEKRLHELEEKRRLKEQRKLEEEIARKKAEEIKREKEQTEIKMLEKTKRQIEKIRQIESAKTSKIAPWSNSNMDVGLSLADIQKAEREKKAEQLLQQQRLQLQQQQQQLQRHQEQVNADKVSLHFNWANKPIQPAQVKSLAEIQAEEQERLAKEAAEHRLLQQQKEKEVPPTVTGSIWSNQSLSWAATTSISSSSATGFWEEPNQQKSSNKPSNVPKSNSTNNILTVKQKQQLQPKSIKVKTKKEDPTVNNNNKNTIKNGPMEEFKAWCTKALANLNSSIDISTFIMLLCDIESAADVKEICRDNLGENVATHQFVLQFLEKRRSYKPKVGVSQKDDMCVPAPAITPQQHNSDFQEVKGKGKKTKKSKMTKVDARSLGFSVTAAHDRINVGARDYGDNS